MKTKVGMITIYQRNYGAFLQAYALQQLLKQCGYEPEIIRYDYFRDHCLMGISLSYIKKPIYFTKRLFAELFRYHNHKKRIQVFKNSISKYLVESKEYYSSYNKLEKNPPCYDIYLTGSDQVFNLNLSPQARKARLLEFVKNGVRASYAASTGSNTIQSDYLQEFLVNIRQFNVVSVRESGFRDLLENEYHIEAINHLDPTLVLCEQNWLQFAKFPEELQGKQYLFYYRITYQKEAHDEAERLSRQYALPIVVVNDNETFDNMIRIDHIISPEEWVGLIANSEYVITNSFHGAAFSIKLNKKVRIVLPEHGKDRIISLLEKCDLMKLTFSDYIIPDDLTQLYQEARMLFENEQKKTIDYLSGLSDKKNELSNGW